MHRFWQRQERQARVWDLEAWIEAEPLRLRRSGSWYAAGATFHPSGEWLIVSTQFMERLTFWPLGGSRPSVVGGYSGFMRPIAFSPDGKWLATVWGRGAEMKQVRLWPLPGSGSAGVRKIALPEEGLWNQLVFDPRGRYLLVAGLPELAYVVPLDGSPPQRLAGLSDGKQLPRVAVSPSGQLIAAAVGHGEGEKALRVLDVGTGDLRRFHLAEGSTTDRAYERAVWSLVFANESTLYSAGDGGIRRWDLSNGSHEIVMQAEPEYLAEMSLGPNRGTALVLEHNVATGGAGESHLPIVLDLTTGKARSLAAFGQRFTKLGLLVLDYSGTVAVTGDQGGVIRVGRVAEDNPHLLVGHVGPVDAVAISPDGRWVASAGEDNTLRLWPAPDLDRPPLHTLPLDDLLAQLTALTNIRVVRDPESVEGWSVTLGPFPGWHEVPTW